MQTHTSKLCTVRARCMQLPPIIITLPILGSTTFKVMNDPQTHWSGGFRRNVMTTTHTACVVRTGAGAIQRVAALLGCPVWPFHPRPRVWITGLQLWVPLPARRKPCERSCPCHSDVPEPEAHMHAALLCRSGDSVYTRQRGIHTFCFWDTHRIHTLKSWDTHVIHENHEKKGGGG